MSLKVPDGWNRVEIHRYTPHGQFEVTVYPDGMVCANLWCEGMSTPIGPRYAGSPSKAIEACDQRLRELNASSQASCGAEAVDANGAPV